MRNSDYYADTYAKSHASEGYGQHYSKTFRKGFYALEWEQIEKPLLQRILRAIPGVEGMTALDFACGTARISNTVAGVCKDVVGVDISEAMISAAEPAPNVSLRVHDLISTPLDQHFPVATAFRFFLNAEPDLREAGMAAVARQLAPGGLFITNIHINADAPLGLIYRLRNRLTKTLRNRTMSRAEFVALAERHELRLKQIDYYGYTPRPGPINIPGMGIFMTVIESVGRVLPFISGRLANSFICTFEKQA
jgi:SAM-dependent methyltransferase